MKNIPNYILHVDGDSFFVACEAAAFPHLRGKAVVVGQERGIACAMSCEAKKLGVTRGMPIFQIKKYFPEVIVLPSHFELYHMYNEKLANILRRFFSVVEVYSIDECFAVVEADMIANKKKAVELIKKIKSVTERELGITFSFGLARTKVLAKVASRAQKPDGLTVIFEEDEEIYLRKTPISKVWGIGRRMAPQMAMRGVKTAWDFCSIGEPYVQKNFNKPVIELWRELRGESCMKVGNHHESSKSLQSTRTFTPASMERSFVFSELSKNIEVAFSRMREEGLVTNIGWFFLKTSEFKYFSKEVRLDTFTDNPSDMLRVIEKDFDLVFKEAVRYRTTGITLGNLTLPEFCEQDLFGIQEKSFQSRPVMKAMDEIAKTFGTHSIYLASSMKSIVKRREENKVRNLSDNFIYNLPVPYLGEVY